MSNTPTWLDGYQRAIVDYLLKHDFELRPGSWEQRLSPLSEHFKECGVKEIFEVRESVEQESVFDTFDSDASRAAAYVAAVFSCNCGEYERAELSREDTISSIIYGIVNYPEQ